MEEKYLKTSCRAVLCKLQLYKLRKLKIHPFDYIPSSAILFSRDDALFFQRTLSMRMLGRTPLRFFNFFLLYLVCGRSVEKGPSARSLKFHWSRRNFSIRVLESRKRDERDGG